MNGKRPWRLYVAATARVSESVTVKAEVVTPVEGAPEAHPCVVTVTLTNPATDDVIASPKPVVVPNPQDVSRAAIGEIVDTVVDTAVDEPKGEVEIPSEDASTVVEAQNDVPQSSEQETAAGR